MLVRLHSVHFYSDEANNSNSLNSSSVISIDNKGEKADCVLSGFSGFPLYSMDSRCTLGIPIVLPGFSLYSQDFHRTPGISTVLLGFPLYSRDSRRTPGILVVLPVFSSYSQDSHITSKNCILPRMCPPYHIVKNRNAPVTMGHRQGGKGGFFGF
jgi:hypothetical protein